ncbi:MAG: hypothetical protein RL115_758 [Bacteroidota bacterium]|jgi:hypothetical protein
MKKTIITVIGILCISLVQATQVPAPLAAHALLVTVPGTKTTISLAHFLTLTPKSYAKEYGIKLSLKKRIQFKLAQQHFRKLINEEGFVDASKRKAKKGFFSKWSWHWGGFALGFVPILGPVVALFFKDDYKWDRFHTALTVNGVLAAALALGLGASGGF